MWFLFAFGSAILSAAASIGEKKALLRSNALTFSLLLSAVLMLYSLGTMFFVDVTAVTSLTLYILLLKGVVNALAFLFVMMALQRAEISSTLPILGLTPGLVALLAYGTIGDVITAREVVGVILMIAGVFFLEKQHGTLQPANWYIWAAVLLFTISAVLDKALVSGYKTHPLVVLFYQHAVFLILYTVLYFQKNRSFRRLYGSERPSIIGLVVFVAVVTIIYRYAQLAATQLAPVALVLAVKRTSVFFASLVGGTMFSEQRLPWKLFGAALIIVAGFFILRAVG